MAGDLFDCITHLGRGLFELLADLAGLLDGLGDLHLAQDAFVLRVQTHKRTNAEVVATSCQDYLPDYVAWLFFGYFGSVSRWSVAGPTHDWFAPLRITCPTSSKRRKVAGNARF
jgi:hypothetical protein